MTRGVKRKSSASELDLDTLFADLDATVKSATRARTTPKKPVPFSPKHNKSENAWYLGDTVRKAERERELLALCDGLGEDIDPTPTKPTRRAPSLHATPLRKREVCCLSAVPRCGTRLTYPAAYAPVSTKWSVRDRPQCSY